MVHPFDIEILPTVFFEVTADKQKLISNTSFFRKRANTTDKIGEDVPNPKFNMTLESSLPTAHNKPLKPKVNNSLNQSCSLTVPKHKYELLLDQNKLKDEKIMSLEGQVRVLREKNEELHRLLGIIGEIEGNQLIESTKLAEVTNQPRDRKRLKK